MWSEREIEVYKENVLELMAHLEMDRNEKMSGRTGRDQSVLLPGAPERGFLVSGGQKKLVRSSKRWNFSGQLKSMDGRLIASYYAEAKA